METVGEEGNPGGEEGLGFIEGDFFDAFIAGPFDVGFSDPELASLIEGEAVVADAEVGAEEEGDEGALLGAVDFIGEEADELGLVHVADEEFAFGEAKELRVDGVDGLGGGVGEFSVGEEGGGGGAHFFEFFDGDFEGVAGPSLFPDEGGGVAVEVSFGDVVEGVGAAPVALVIGDPEAVIFIDVDAIGRAEAGGEGDGFAIGGDLEDPAAVGNAGVHAAGFGFVFLPGLGVVFDNVEFAFEADGIPGSADDVLDAGAIGGDVEGDVEVALGVAGGAVDELVVVAGDAEGVAEVLVVVGEAVLICVSEAGELSPLGDDE